MWIAYYPAETYPQVEAPEYNNKFHAWQYTNKGNVSGISGNVDMVVCYFRKELAKPKNPNAVPQDAKEPNSSSTTTPKEDIMAGNTFTAKNEMVTAKEKTNLRTGPSTEGTEVVYTLPHGEYVKRIGVHSNGWSKLEYNGQIVYAITSYLTTEVNVEETTEEDVTSDIVSE